ncbi:Hok/Gef family protein [Vibrio vulnificus]|nr:Hok/Gef family protein [Vibrio vulnificus]EIA0806854.1 Hok/Gef family protein [Vibrio vulnificus]MCU8269169.1 Hok/Gef family protein [Vibrio vulnificus]RZP95330.1 Hok/Gef family protein [Vibrio vulnificus]RZR39153.1 Hok/Gef family protein [Vibrio vulnificus]
MPRSKTALVGLIVICLTLITLTWMLQGSLCELRVQGGHVLTLALTLAYESR